jgi:hypothetical protein
MGSLSLFLSSKTAAALVSMLLFVSCLQLSSRLRSEEEREEEKQVASMVIRILELSAFLPAGGRMEMPLPPLGKDLQLRGRWEGSQVVKVWEGKDLLVSSLLPLPVEGGFFEISLPSSGRLLVIREENLLLLEGVM